MSNLPNFDEQIQALAESIGTKLTTSGVNTAQKIYDASVPLLTWIDYLRKSELTGVADELLDGLRASVVETLGCASAGLVRPAIFALRGQIDLTFAWLYFKDHPIEWEKVSHSGEGFVLKKDATEYLNEYVLNFKQRFSALCGSKNRTETDPYWLLSAYVHSQSPATVPVYKELKTLVWNQKHCDDAIKFQRDVSEYISDIFLSYFARKWASIPKSVVMDAESRLTPAGLKKIFF